MSNIWFCADLHFSHANILKYQNRPFLSIGDMDECLIQTFNSYIKPEDEVYCLGDFSFSDPTYYLKRLNGKWHLIKGNHDHRQPNRPFSWVKDTYMLRSVNPMIFMCHYPMRQWPQSHYGVINLHGHCHGSLPALGRQMDVGVDCNNYAPVHIEEVFSKMKDIPYGIHHERSS